MTLWHWFALPFFAELCLVLLMLVFTDDAVVLATLPPLLIIVCYDFIEKNASKNFSWYSSGFLLLLWTWVLCFFLIELQLLICEWCLQVDRASTASLCELNCWYPDNTHWNHPQITISKQVHIPLCSINLSFPLPLLGCRLQESLKNLRTLIKVCFEKSKPTYRETRQKISQ